MASSIHPISFHCTKKINVADCNMRTLKQYEYKVKRKKKSFEQWYRNKVENGVLNPGPPAREAKEVPLGHGVFSGVRCITRRIA